MIFKRFFLLGLLVLLFFALAGGRARSSFAEGYTQGYVAGLQAASPQTGETAGETPAPATGARFDRHWHGWGLLPLFGLLGLFFPFLLIVLGFGLVFGRRRPWRHRRWHGDHGPAAGGPWGRKPPREKGPEDVEPDVRQA